MRQENSWGFLASQPNLINKPWFWEETLCQKNKGGGGAAGEMAPELRACMALAEDSSVEL